MTVPRIWNQFQHWSCEFVFSETTIYFIYQHTLFIQGKLPSLHPMIITLPRSFYIPNIEKENNSKSFLAIFRHLLKLKKNLHRTVLTKNAQTQHLCFYEYLNHKKVDNSVPMNAADYNKRRMY